MSVPENKAGTAVSIHLRKEEHMCLREVRDKAEKGQIIKGLGCWEREEHAVSEYKAPAHSEESK